MWVSPRPAPAAWCGRKHPDFVFPLTYWERGRRCRSSRGAGRGNLAAGVRAIQAALLGSLVTQRHEPARHAWLRHVAAEAGADVKSSPHILDCSQASKGSNRPTDSAMAAIERRSSGLVTRLSPCELAGNCQGASSTSSTSRTKPRSGTAITSRYRSRYPLPKLGTSPTSTISRGATAENSYSHGPQQMTQASITGSSQACSRASTGSTMRTYPSSRGTSESLREYFHDWAAELAKV